MESDTPATAEETRCAECNTVLVEGQDRETTEGGVFCRPCFDNLTAQLERAIAEQGENVDYTMAAVGGVIGGALGVLAWWGFTVVTNIAFGLVAVVIGIAVGKGVTILAGHKRSQGLQILSVVISVLSFAYASYLVNRTFILRYAAEEGQDVVLPLLPPPDLLLSVVSLNFGIMDLVFLAIVVWEAWKIPAPLRLGG
jgi:hypothetical protein